MKKIFSLAFFSAAICFFILSCTKKETAATGTNIAVFIPGVISGSPIYGMLADGVQKAASEFNSGKETVGVTVIEGGFNQAEWENQITALASSGNFDLIVSSNPSMPDIVNSVSSKFPMQKFLLMDGELAGNPSVYSLRYNQREQAYMAGYIAALVSLETDPFGKKILGLVAAQEYPVMNNTILPGYIEGARSVDPDFSVDFRIVGNWFDAAKGAELANEIIRNGAVVLLPIAGGAGEGVVQAAYETGAKIVWFDTNGYAIRPGTVVGSTVLYQDKAASEKTMLWLKGELPFGKAEVAGISSSYVDFIEDDPLYVSFVSSAVREKQSELIKKIRSGTLLLEN